MSQDAHFGVQNLDVTSRATVFASYFCRLEFQRSGFGSDPGKGYYEEIVMLLTLKNLCN